MAVVASLGSVSDSIQFYVTLQLSTRRRGKMLKFKQIKINATTVFDNWKCHLH